MTKLDFKPVLRLNVYQNSDEFYLETEEAVIVDRKVTFKSPIPFRADHLKSFAQTIFKQDEESEPIHVIPDNVLFRRKRFVVLYEKPKVYKHLFSDSLKLKSGMFPMPGLIYMFTGFSLYIYAYLGNERPDATTKLYKAPLYNVSGDGSVCMGDNKMSALGKLKTDYVAASAATSLFWSSKFSHYQDTNKLDGMTLEKYYRGKFNTYSVFPTEKLKEDGKKLEEKIHSQIR